MGELFDKSLLKVTNISAIDCVEVFVDDCKLRDWFDINIHNQFYWKKIIQFQLKKDIDASKITYRN